MYHPHLIQLCLNIHYLIYSLYLSVHGNQGYYLLRFMTIIAIIIHKVIVAFFHFFIKFMMVVIIYHQKYFILMSLIIKGRIVIN